MSLRHTYPGSCHCGNLQVVLASDATPAVLGARRDGCSFCTLHRAAYTSDPAGSLSLTAADATLLARYRFGTRTADFLLCRSCGVFVAAYMPEPAVAVVNVAVLAARAAFLALEPPVVDLDGESLASRLTRRRARWTPVASFVVGGLVGG